MDPRVAYFVDPSPEADLISFSSARDPTHEVPDLPINSGFPAAGVGLCPNEGCINSEYAYTSMYGAADVNATECASCRSAALRRRAAAHHRWRRRANLIPPECLSIDNSRTHYINRDMNLFIEHFLPKSLVPSLVRLQRRLNDGNVEGGCCTDVVCGSVRAPRSIGAEERLQEAHRAYAEAMANIDSIPSPSTASEEDKSTGHDASVNESAQQQQKGATMAAPINPASSPQSQSKSAAPACNNTNKLSSSTIGAREYYAKHCPPGTDPSELYSLTVPLPSDTADELGWVLEESYFGAMGRGTVRDVTIRSSRECPLLFTGAGKGDGEKDGAEGGGKCIVKMPMQLLRFDFPEARRAICEAFCGANTAPPFNGPTAAVSKQQQRQERDANNNNSISNSAAKNNVTAKGISPPFAPAPAPAAPRAAAADIVFRPYKLVLYQKGDFFMPHSDSMSDARMIGSLAVQLPVGRSRRVMTRKRPSTNPKRRDGRAAADVRAPEKQKEQARDSANATSSAPTIDGYQSASSQSSSSSSSTSSSYSVAPSLCSYSDPSSSSRAPSSASSASSRRGVCGGDEGASSRAKKEKKAAPPSASTSASNVSGALVFYLGRHIPKRRGMFPKPPRNRDGDAEHEEEEGEWEEEEEENEYPPIVGQRRGLISNRATGAYRFRPPEGREEELKVVVDLTSHLAQPSLAAIEEDLRREMGLSRTGDGSKEAEEGAEERNEGGITTESESAPKSADGGGRAAAASRQKALRALTRAVAANSYDIKYAAWLGDIVHEVTRVRTRHRAVLLYRLYRVRARPAAAVVDSTSARRTASSHVDADTCMSAVSGSVDALLDRLAAYRAAGSSAHSPSSSFPPSNSTAAVGMQRESLQQSPKYYSYPLRDPQSMPSDAEAEALLQMGRTHSQERDREVARRVRLGQMAPNASYGAVCAAIGPPTFPPQPIAALSSPSPPANPPISSPTPHPRPIRFASRPVDALMASGLSGDDARLQGGASGALLSEVMAALVRLRSGGGMKGILASLEASGVDVAKQPYARLFRRKNEGAEASGSSTCISDVSPLYVGVVLRHAYPPAGLVPSALKGADAALYRIAEQCLGYRVTLHSGCELRDDYSCAPFRAAYAPTKAASASTSAKGRKMRQTHSAPDDCTPRVDTTDEGENDGPVAAVHKTVYLTQPGQFIDAEVDLDNGDAPYDCAGRYPLLVRGLWLQIGHGTLVTGGHVLGNVDCGTDWWYRTAVLLVHPEPSVWARRRALFVAALRGTESFRRLALEADLFMHIMSFM